MPSLQPRADATGVIITLANVVSVRVSMTDSAATGQLPVTTGWPRIKDQMAEFGADPEVRLFCLAVGAAKVALAIFTPASMLLAIRGRLCYVTQDDPLAVSMGALSGLGQLGG